VAVVWAAFFNFVAAFVVGTAVAKTIGKGLIEPGVVDPDLVLGALIGAIIWNLITWYFGLPSSSSHALMGGLGGAAIAKAGFPALQLGGWVKPLLFIFLSPLLGMVLALLLTVGLSWLLRGQRPGPMDRVFRRLQLLSAALYSLSHGANDAQKTMGIIALALFTGTKSGAFNDLPEWATFLRTPEFVVNKWVVVVCALTMAAGPAAGGWRIIRTLGHKMVKMQPVHGFAAETTAAMIIQVATAFGIPLSTTHAITTSIMGVGCVKRFGAVKWGVVERIVWAWIFTLPVCGLIGFLTELLCNLAGYH